MDSDTKANPMIVFSEEGDGVPGVARHFKVRPVAELYRWRIVGYLTGDIGLGSDDIRI